MTWSVTSAWSAATTWLAGQDQQPPPGSEDWLSEHYDGAVVKPLQIVLIVAVAWIIRRIVHRAIDHTLERLTKERPRRMYDLPGRVPTVDPLTTVAGERRRQRYEAVGSVLRSTSSLVIYGVAVLMVLSLLGLPLASVIASAGLITAALAFGAQSLVRDFLAGIALLMEDQYGVGDVIDAGAASGTVEEVGLRVTRLRDSNGVIWYIRNGEIIALGNKTQGWAVATLDIPVPYGEDLGRVNTVLAAALTELAEDPDWKPKILEPPSVLGIEAVTTDTVTIRVSVSTPPLAHDQVTRELRARLKRAFDAAGIRVPLPANSYPAEGR
ncbi:MAG TPA: mechanosensitive ion channel family protein [Actinomycetes bacterium]|nr:mechanosensitive ion channel family protein [Actinomycetes bacterium]